MRFSASVLGLAALASASPLVTRANTSDAAPTVCNGRSEYCSRAYSNVSQIASHDSAFVGELPQQNQLWSVEDQLKNNSPATKVPDSYTGPHLPKGPEGQEHLGSITEEFVEQMIEFFKKEGRLPARYVWQILLGANRAFLKESSLVDYKVEKGTTIEIGRAHV